MFIDYKDLDLLSKLTNRHGRIVSRRKDRLPRFEPARGRQGDQARFMGLMPYVGG